MRLPLSRQDFERFLKDRPHFKRMYIMTACFGPLALTILALTTWRFWFKALRKLRCKMLPIGNILRFPLKERLALLAEELNGQGH